MTYYRLYRGEVRGSAYTRYFRTWNDQHKKAYSSFPLGSDIEGERGDRGSNKSGALTTSLEHIMGLIGTSYLRPERGAPRFVPILNI